MDNGGGDKKSRRRERQKTVGSEGRRGGFVKGKSKDGGGEGTPLLLQMALVRRLEGGKGDASANRAQTGRTIWKGGRGYKEERGRGGGSRRGKRDREVVSPSPSPSRQSGRRRGKELSKTQEKALRARGLLGGKKGRKRRETKKNMLRAAAKPVREQWQVTQQGSFLFQSTN